MNYTENNAIEILLEHYNKEYAELEKIENNKHFFLHKIKHSFWVLRAWLLIIENDEILKDLDEKTKEKFLFSALLHDLWRFSQHDGKKILNENLVDHWLLGYGVLKNLWYTDAWVLLSVKYHNKPLPELEKIEEDPEFKDLSPELKKEARMLIDYVRDADKLENLEYMWLTNFHREMSELSLLDPNWNWKDLSDEVLDYLLEWRVIPYSIRKSNPDIITSYISWINDINFNWTKKLIKSNNIFPTYMDYLKEIWYTKRLEEIKDFINNY